MNPPEVGHFGCPICERRFVEEIPPLWSGLEMWLECCGRPVVLLAVYDGQLEPNLTMGRILPPRSP